MENVLLSLNVLNDKEKDSSRIILEEFFIFSSFINLNFI